MLAGIVLWLVRQRERQALQHAARRELETKVLERTAELRDVNYPAGPRRRQAPAVRRALSPLARGACPGQPARDAGPGAAGVAHEINQPVAAIRTYSENAAAFIDRGMADKAGGNLVQVIQLTDRIAQITGELRSFARRKTPNVGPVRLDEAIEAALLLVHHRVAGSGTEVVWDVAEADCSVAADRVRLEQVFVNLIQNALDAAVEGRGGRIRFVPASRTGQSWCHSPITAEGSRQPFVASCSRRSPRGARKALAWALRSPATFCASSAAI